MPENRRSSQRVEVRLPIEYQSEGEWKLARTGNLSIGGAFIHSEERVPLGARLKVRFAIPNQKEPIEVGAQVRWTASDGFGIQFDGLRARDVWALGKFLEKPTV